MPVHFGFWDITLVLAVSTQATVLAYLRQPRLKAFAYVLPFPFTLATLAMGRPVDATNVVAMIPLFLYIQGVRLLYRARLPIVVAIAVSALGYTAVGWAIAPLISKTDTAFWLVCALVLALALALYLGLPHRDEPDHRTTLPVYVKMPIIAAVIVALIAIKNSLQGFMTLFPMVGVVAAYEARYSLWTVGRSLTAWMVAMIPMMAVLRLAQGELGLGLALVLGWAAFLSVLLPLTRSQWVNTRK